MAEKEIQQLGEMLHHYLIDLITTALRESKEQSYSYNRDTEPLYQRDAAFNVLAALCLREPDARITLTPLDLMRVPRGFTLIEEQELTGDRIIRVVSPSSGVAALTQIETAREKL